MGLLSVCHKHIDTSLSELSPFMWFSSGSKEVIHKYVCCAEIVMLWHNYLETGCTWWISLRYAILLSTSSSSLCMLLMLGQCIFTCGSTESPEQCWRPILDSYKTWFSMQTSTIWSLEFAIMISTKSSCFKNAAKLEKEQAGSHGTNVSTILQKLCKSLNCNKRVLFKD